MKAYHCPAAPVPCEASPSGVLRWRLSLVALLGADTPLSIIGDRMRMCQRSVGFSESSFACSWKLGGRITRHISTPTIRTMSGFSGSIPLSCLRETYHEGSAGWSKRGRNCIKMN